MAVTRCTNFRQLLAFDRTDQGLHLFKVLNVYPQLLQNTPNCTSFKIFIPPIRNHCPSPRSWIDPLSMGSSSFPWNFFAAQNLKSSGEFSIIHCPARMRDSNQTGDFVPSAIKAEGNSLPVSS